MLHTEPLKVRKVFSSSSSDRIGWRATKLINLPSARLLPSMNSRSETLVRTADRRQPNTDQGDVMYSVPSGNEQAITSVSIYSLSN